MKGLTYDPETEIQAVDGATIGLFLALKGVVGTGDEVIIPSPFFTSYDAEVMPVRRAARSPWRCVRSTACA